MAEKIPKSSVQRNSSTQRVAACTTAGSFCNIIVKYGTENCNTRINFNKALIRKRNIVPALHFVQEYDMIEKRS